jgi:hypothetical protein
MTGARLYRHYGLTIETNVALRGLPVADTRHVDVRIEFVRARERPPVDSTWSTTDPPLDAWRAPGNSGSRLRLQFEGSAGNWAEFLIEDGGESVRVTLSESSVLDDACELLTGSVFSCVLAQRGLTCLHASVVAIEGRVIALVGAKAAGKSTLALALAQRGGQLVSDDVAAVASRQGVFGVAVGRSALRVRPDSVASLAAGFSDLRPVWASGRSPLAKRYFVIDADGERRETSWLPLAGVYLLSPRGTDAAHVRPVPPGELLPALLANRHMSRVLDQAGHRRDFDCLATLVRHVPGHELRRPDGLEKVSASAEALALDVVGLASPVGGFVKHRMTS